MELIGKLFKKLPEVTGESQRGLWVKMEFVIETQEQFPKQVCFSLWGEDKVAIVRNMQLGAEMKVYFSPESKEYNGRWYTDLRCFRIDALGAVNQTQQQVTQQTTQVQASQQGNTNTITNVQGAMFDSENNSAVQEDNDLPF